MTKALIKACDSGLMVPEGWSMIGGEHGAEQAYHWNSSGVLKSDPQARSREYILPEKWEGL